MFLRALRIILLYLFSNHSLVKALGTLIITLPFLFEIRLVFLNQVIKLAFEIESSISPNAICQSS
ncbi:hypothetical protein ES703_47364 [subsurface metagenome]